MQMNCESLLLPSGPEQLCRSASTTEWQNWSNHIIFEWNPVKSCKIILNIVKFKQMEIILVQCIDYYLKHLKVEQYLIVTLL